MERIMAIYDVEPSYAERFADVVNQREKVPFLVVPFTSLENLREYARQNPVEILLVNSLVPEEGYRGIEARQIIRLADGEMVRMPGNSSSVYKYQSADSIVREVMAYYCESSEEDLVMVSHSRARIIGIYSPIGRCLKTSLAWTLGQQIAKDSRVLLVSMEEYSGFSRLLPESGSETLSEVMYAFRQKKNHGMWLASMVYSQGNLDYILPVRYPEDLDQMSGTELAGLLQKIAGECGYEVLVVDAGNVRRELFEFLECFDMIYMPVKDDCVSAAKLEEFEEHLTVAGKRGLKEKIQKLKLPYHSNFGRQDTYMDQLLWGELGDYVRQLWKGTGRKDSWDIR